MAVAVTKLQGLDAAGAGRYGASSTWDLQGGKGGLAILPSTHGTAL